ncbi:MAG: ricin-type beta-trefoil lectin domain protein [Turneriella sp.]|nr:ricin-type beta-trefoil lectin domain protein [Turneriella sp.]
MQKWFIQKANAPSLLWALCALLLLVELRCQQASVTAAKSADAAGSTAAPNTASVPATAAATTTPAALAATWNPAVHSLDYENVANASRITPGTKTFGGKTDRIFTDGLGREVYFRGFNISGEVKLAESGFKPFKNPADARASLDALGRNAGSNMIRFTVAWEGIHTAVDTIDYGYLDAIVEQMRAAFANRIYVLLDWHTDLFSRHLFNANSWHTGNGAPAWITPAADYPAEYCGVVCVSWAQNLQTNEAIRRAARNFFNDKEIQTTAGTRRMQTEFVWHIGQAAAYIKSKLTAEEFNYIVGVDPLNEPYDGGTEGLSYKDWDNQKLWPFYQRVRAELNAQGWNDKPIFAEPLVFWSSIAGPVAPATGGYYLDYKPGPGFVFNAHFYDQGRMGVADTSVARNGAYFAAIDLIRDEARFLDIPVFVSEFGMWLGGSGQSDTARVVNATYQALETSDQGNAKDRHASLYQPVVGATEWHWDYYYDHHNEYQNGNPSKLLTSQDAWNGENYSVVKNYASAYNVPQTLVERAYVRYSQGRILNMYYNAMVPDAANDVMSWGAIRINLAGQFEGKPYLKGKKFIFTVWQGRSSDAPTEIFIPRHWAANPVVITEKRSYNGTLVKDAAFTQAANEVVLASDPGKVAGGGSRIVIFDDADAGETSATLHFALAVDNGGLSAQDIADLQNGIIQTLAAGVNPVYFTTQMTPSGYAAEADLNWFRLKTYGRCMDVVNGMAVLWQGIQLYDCNGSNAQWWTYDNGFFRTRLNTSYCLDNRGQTYNNGQIQLWTCDNNNNLKFDWIGTSIRNRNNNTYAVDAYGSASGSRIGQWTYNGGVNQQWIKSY